MTQEEQKVQELLKPRVKVIAPWPEMERWLARVGDILTDPGGNETVRNQNDDAVPTFEWETFPHLFRKLEWFDERDIEDMPDYVRCISEFHRIIKEGRVYKVVSKGSFDDDMELNMRASKYWCFVEGYERRLNYSHFVPATSADYTAYIEKQPTTLNQGV